MGPYTGELAALIAAFGFSITSVLFTLASQRFGAILPMRGAVPISLLMLMAVHWYQYGRLIPEGAEPERWLLLGISGLLGFWVGSIFILKAFIVIGPRLALLIGALGPIISAILAWVFLDQQLSPITILGIAVTIFGIIWVVSDKREASSSQNPESYNQGIIYAFLGASVQGLSFVVSSQGVSGGFDPLSASVIRLTVATIVIWGLAAFQGEVGMTLRTFMQEPRALRQLGGAALAGPTISALLVLIALQHTPVGVASTISNITPIFLIPLGYVIFKERITQRAIVGTCIAIVGTALLFL